MKKKFKVCTCLFIVFFAAIFFLSQHTVHAEVKQVRTPAQQQFQEKETVPGIPALTICPDLKVSFIIVKTASGFVMLNSTISNIGGRDFSTPAQATWDVHRRYTSLSESQYFDTELICTPKKFSALKKGDSLSFSIKYQIPNFDGWVPSGKGADVISTFYMNIQKDGSPFKPCEDANSNNNTFRIEVCYKKKQPT